MNNPRIPEPSPCRACGGDEILVAQKGLSFEDNVGAHDDDYTYYGAAHICERCGHLEFFASNPAAWGRLLGCRKVKVQRAETR